MELQAAYEAHRPIIDQLKAALAKKMCAHALIFEAPKGAYAFELGLIFGQLLYGEEDPNVGGTHAARIAHETHPNLVVIRPTKQFILKEDILALQRNFNQTALEPGPKLYLIDQADRMNPQAANALLKFLEEPHPDIYGVLITEDASRLLPTLQSRSQKLTLPSLSQPLLQSLLEAEGFERDDAHLASVLNAHFESAKGFLNDALTQQALDMVDWAYEKLLEETSLLIPMQKQFPELIKDKALFERFIDIMMVYQKDIICVKMEAQPSLVFHEHYEKMTRLAKRKTRSQLRDEFAAMITLKDRLTHPIHLPLAFDNLMMRLESEQSI